MCWGGMIGMFWKKRLSLKWRARGSENNQRRCERRKWRRRARVLVWRRRMPWIEQDGEWELERLLLEWGKLWPTPFMGINLDQNWIDWLIEWMKGNEMVCAIYTWVHLYSHISKALHFYHYLFLFWEPEPVCSPWLLSIRLIFYQW